jgi:hypothetical protein
MWTSPAASELQPLEAGDVPDDVQVTFTERGESGGASGCVDRIPPLRVAHEHRHRGTNTGKHPMTNAPKGSTT